jgi:hypothetical protein
MIEELEAPLGLYWLNQALIRLERDVNVLTAEVDGGLKLSRIAVLCHEYAHFLHNFSTPAGVFQFVAQLRLLRIFTRTVDENGNCRGSAYLEKEINEKLDSTLAWFQHLTGTSFIWSQKQEIRLHKISYEDPISIEFANQTYKITSVTTVFGTSNAESANPQACKLGTLVITEGLAWEIERLIYTSVDESTEGLDQRTPQAPYKLARCVFEGVSGCSPNAETMAKILLLSLFSSDSGLALIGIAKEISKRGETPLETAFEHVLQKTRTTEYLDNTIELIKAEIHGFAQRGPAGRGLAALAQRSISLLEERKTNIFFEIDAFKRIIEPGILSELINKYPPCPIIQVEDDSTGLILLGSQTPDQFALNDLGAAQGLLHFMWSHIDSNGIKPTKLVPPRACRFQSFCSMPIAKDPSGPCNTTPWKNFVCGMDEGCWYGVGVGCARGSCAVNNDR